MKLLAVENFRLTGRNMAGGDAIIDYNGRNIKAEFNYYLQGNQCLGIRLGRHEKEVTTALLEDFIRNHLTEFKKMVEPDIARLKKERLERMMQVDHQ
ncbi:MAG: hypothetical protein GX808_09490 [Syntrophomonadaceae bacterium]|jgi:hypothetical protein|nr:hypothetical protein [Syntrophomonadaceae bacterium]